VLVMEGLENLSPRTEAEAKLAQLKGFEPNVRLACQTRAFGPATIRRLVWDAKDAELAQSGNCNSCGREASLAILFSDIRNFTPFAERNLAYDVAHVLNRYFLVMGGAVLRHGGYIDKYIGDGMMALFGIDGAEPAVASRQAVLAGMDMIRALPSLNDYLSKYVATSIEIGIGIHTGSVIVAELGHPQRRQLTAIGDAVNVASRVESATKQAGAHVLVTQEVAIHLGGEFQLGRQMTTQLKGTSGERVLVEVLGATGAA
jgi:adenylate cyclase